MGINYEVKEIRVIRVNGIEFPTEADAEIFDKYLSEIENDKFYGLYTNKIDGKYTEVRFYSLRKEEYKEELVYKVSIEQGRPLEEVNGKVEYKYELEEIQIEDRDELARFIKDSKGFINRDKISRSAIVQRGITHITEIGNGEVREYTKSDIEKLIDDANKQTKGVASLIQKIERGKKQSYHQGISEEEYEKRLQLLIESGIVNDTTFIGDMESAKKLSIRMKEPFFIDGKALKVSEIIQTGISIDEMDKGNKNKETYIDNSIWDNDTQDIVEEEESKVNMENTKDESLGGGYITRDKLLGEDTSIGTKLKQEDVYESKIESRRERVKEKPIESRLGLRSGRAEEPEEVHGKKKGKSKINGIINYFGLNDDK